MRFFSLMKIELSFIVWDFNNVSLHNHFELLLAS